MANMSGDDQTKVPLKEDSTDKPSDSSRPSGLNLEVNLPQQRRSVNRLQNPSSLAENLQNPPSQETVNEANGLYLIHFARQMTELGFEPGYIGPNSRYIPSARNARTLRTLADQFALSPQRQWVREQAQNVDLESLNFVTFQQLLNGLFEEGGVTWERVLVLFYFCTDLSIRAIQERFIDHLLEIYRWTTVFLSGRFSLWVEEQGGWGVVLQNSVNYIARASIVGACCAAFAAGYMFYRKSR